MNAAKHTPEPWAVGGPTEFVNQLRIEPCIGVVYGAGDELAANARLIAAAPELLGACLAMLAWDEAEKTAKPFDEDGGTGFYQRIAMCTEAFDKAREAIAKATGEPA